jgi:hypothetical protein
MATDAEIAAWRADAVQVAGRWLGRRMAGEPASRRELWAEEAASRVAMRWASAGAPPTRGQQVSYIHTTAHRVALNELDARRDPIFARAASLDQQVEGEDGGSRPVISEEELGRGQEQLGAVVRRAPLGARTGLGLEADARHLRSLLDRLAWARSSREEVHFWLLWLIEVRRTVGERVYGEGELALAAFDAALARLVLWHGEEEAHAICGDSPTLGAFWRDAVAVLHRVGELDQQAICGVFGGLGEQVSMDRLHQWQRRMRVKVLASCERQSVTYVELAEALSFEGGAR